MANILNNCQQVRSGVPFEANRLGKRGSAKLEIIEVSPPAPKVLCVASGFRNSIPKLSATQTTPLRADSQKKDEDPMNDAEIEYSSEESEDETEYTIDTRNNYYSLEQLRKNLQERMNTSEYNAAIASLKDKIEKNYPEKLEKKTAGDNLV